MYCLLISLVLPQPSFFPQNSLSRTQLKIITNYPESSASNKLSLSVIRQRVIITAHRYSPGHPAMCCRLLGLSVSQQPVVCLSLCQRDTRHCHWIVCSSFSIQQLLPPESTALSSFYFLLLLMSLSCQRLLLVSIRLMHPRIFSRAEIKMPTL